jgi:hypothetical protein
MRWAALVLTLGLGCVAGAPTGPDPDARAAGPCYGLVIEDTLFIDTHRPLLPTGPRLARPEQYRRGVQWRARRLPNAVDTIIVQAWVQVCPP